ncbi:ATP-binding cassette domain-containing protein [Streptomyces sp. NPDC003036]|uniref:ATP-binding cassette domain-containing protein n=1 Tax=Streptomyces sp. NPDC003036 TaxID=3154442 RepID=UPI0033A06382
MGRRYGRPGGPWVLRGVELALEPGALVRVEGTNGSGKSTLLRLIAGIDAPTEGRVTGRPRRTAYVPERFPAALPFTATGYLVHLGRVQGLRRAVAEARAAAWLDRFGAAAHACTPLRDLSKGTSQKVAVAQALLAEPGLLVLDEAWTGLDAAARTELDRAVGERVAAGAAVVFVDHDPRRLAGRPDAVYAVRDGRLIRPTAVPAVPAVPDAREPLVRITASGGRLPDPALPCSPAYGSDGDAGGRVTFTVPAAHSDALLLELLRARPPWHIHAVAPAPADATIPETTTGTAAP